MYRFLFAFVAISFVACSTTEQVELRNEKGIVVERYSRTKVDSLKHGLYEAFDDKGILVETAHYTAGKLDGERKLYYPDGQVQYSEMHKAGTYEGPRIAYYPNGNIELKGQYVKDEAVGVWTGFYESGEKKEEVTFSDNQENGPFKEWYSNGVIKAEGSYENGDKEQGELVLYDLSGEIKKRMHCESGICRTVWTAPTAALNEN